MCGLKTSMNIRSFHYFRNDSGKIVADMEIIFGQYTEMKLFITLYQALYRNGSLGAFPVQPIRDTSKQINLSFIRKNITSNFSSPTLGLLNFILVPGKPPQNISGDATSTTSIRVKWNALPHDSDIILLKIYYVLTSQQNETSLSTDVNVTESGVYIVNLGKFVNYTFWIRSVSRRGLGISSNPIYVTTLEEGDCEVYQFFFFLTFSGAFFLLSSNGWFYPETPTGVAVLNTPFQCDCVSQKTAPSC